MSEEYDVSIFGVKAKADQTSCALLLPGLLFDPVDEGDMTRFSETSLAFQQTIQRYMPEDKPLDNNAV